MILNCYDIDLIKITGWCKNIPAGMNTYFGSPIFSADVLTALIMTDIIYEDKKNSSYRLRPAGYRLLKSTGFDFPKDAKQRSEEEVVSRRCISALVLSTFYRAGIDSFASSKDVLRQEQTYLPSFALRRGKFSKDNIANSTVMRGIYRGNDTVYMVFYVKDNGENVFFSNELKTFNQLTERSGALNRAVIIMGDSYKSLAAIMNKSSKKDSGSYMSILENTSLPVHFLSIGDNGAQVLKVLQMPNYRKIISKAVMRGAYKQPYNGMPDTDTVHHKEPYYPALFAIDMDVKRFDRAYETAKQHGFERIVLYVLPEQSDFISVRYTATKKADVLFVAVKTLNELFKGHFTLYDSPMEPYITPEGGYIHVTFPETPRKTKEP